MTDEASRVDVTSHDRRLVRPLTLSLSRAQEIALIGYFGSSFLYFLQPLPVGHLINLAFVGIFASLGMFGTMRLLMGPAAFAQLLLLLLILVASLLGILARGDWSIAAVGRSITWLLPVSLLVMLIRAEDLRLGVVCRWVCGLNVAANLGVTALYARFNPGLGKFELQSSLFDISSNELSFHLVTFGVLFAILARFPAVSPGAIWLGLASFGHLSKAHLAVAGASGLAALLRGRFFLTVLVLFGVGWLIRWAGENPTVLEVVVPDQFVAVFGRLRDLAVVSVQWFAAGGVADTAVAAAVGEARMMVYSAAVELIGMHPFGLSRSAVDRFLLGLDPHSNLIYLLLREGWIVGLGYLVVIASCLSLLPDRRGPARLLYAVMAYVMARSLLLTYDPVKIVALFVLVSDIGRRGIGERGEGR